MTNEELLSRAEAARAHAYAPYSKFTVGAALLTADGRVFTGANVENASFGLTICAERAAALAAVNADSREFTAIAVAGPPKAMTAPCGACRQVLNEFGPAMIVLFTQPDGVHETTLDALLPHAFGPP